jgi:branched-chain amino acid transport system permease protein
MSAFLSFTVVGLVAGCIYALTASGLVVTYTTSGVFNFAHGAIGMIAAFAYWELAVNQGWPAWAAVIVVLLILAPLMGAVIERVLMRPLHGASVEVNLTVTVGLLLVLLGIASAIWNPTQTRTSPEFFSGHQVKVLGVVLTYHQLTVIIVAIAVAVGLRLFLFRTRTGTAMRAVVDDRELAAMSGASPARFGQLGWVIGAMLAAVAGILLAPLVTLDQQTLTLLVINGYAAAMVGRLRNLPLTFVGGLALGLAENYAVGYLPIGAVLSQISNILPMIFLFVVLLVLPQSRLEQARLTTIRTPRVPGLRESVLWGAALVLGVWLVSGHLSIANLGTLGHGLALAIIMLSLVLLTGYGGQVSLCQLTFVGIGAFTMGKVAGGGSILGVLAAVAVTAAVGAVIALPALRLRGLYLALSTLAFADAMDGAFFTNNSVFGAGGSIGVGRVLVQSNRGFVVLLAAVFAIASIGVLAVRRSFFGRRLAAMSDSPAASATIGLGITRTKLIVFTLSAGLAGLGGALYGGQQGQVGANDFTLLSSLVLLLLAVIWGIKTTSGMLFAGLTFAIFPVIEVHLPQSLQSFQYLATGIGAIGLGRNPNGVIVTNSPLQMWRDRKQAKSSVERAGAITEVVEDRARIAG